MPRVPTGDDTISWMLFTGMWYREGGAQAVDGGLWLVAFDDVQGCARLLGLLAHPVQTGGEVRTQLGGKLLQDGTDFGTQPVQAGAEVGAHRSHLGADFAQLGQHFV